MVLVACFLAFIEVFLMESLWRKAFTYYGMGISRSEILISRDSLAQLLLAHRTPFLPAGHLIHILQSYSGSRLILSALIDLARSREHDLELHVARPLDGNTLNFYH